MADTVNFGIVDGNNAFYGYIDALRRNDLVKILAEPQLTTVSGRAGFVPFRRPVRHPRSAEPGYGVDRVQELRHAGRLRSDRAGQRRHPPGSSAVGERDRPGRSQFFNGYYVPGLRERWVDTAVEMKAGQTLALAGLLQTRTESKNAGLPWLADIPWFGVPFRRVEETVNEVELLILVTPEFVDAVDAEEVPPCGPGESTDVAE